MTLNDLHVVYRSVETKGLTGREVRSVCRIHLLIIYNTWALSCEVHFSGYADMLQQAQRQNMTSNRMVRPDIVQDHRSSHQCQGH